MANADSATDATEFNINWQYTQKETLSPKDFGLEISQTFKDKKVVSVGEYHDENIDTSFKWLQD
jgi:hypothetical protein